MKEEMRRVIISIHTVTGDGMEMDMEMDMEMEYQR